MYDVQYTYSVSGVYLKGQFAAFVVGLMYIYVVTVLAHGWSISHVERKTLVITTKLQ